jgi:hypothetical protein
MFFSPFGRVQYGDYASVQAWAKAHEIAHQTLSLRAAVKGRPVASILTGQHIDNEFFGRHGLTHVALGRGVPPVSGVVPSLLIVSLAEWLTESKFYAWHQMHDADHARLNAAYGVL